MQTDEPTQSNLPPYDPGAPPEPSQMPTWPRPYDGSRRTSGSAGSARAPFGNRYPLILGISFLANVVMIVALAGVLLFGHTGLLSPRGSSSGAPASGPALASPTATATRAATATSTSSSTGWLQVAPSSVHLGCDGNQQTQFVVLVNNGPQRVRWQASLPGFGDQAGITVNPATGALHAGQTVSIQIQLNPDSGGGQQGAIQFAPDTSDAGAPATLTYTADSCNN